MGILSPAADVPLTSRPSGLAIHRFKSNCVKVTVDQLVDQQRWTTAITNRFTRSFHYSLCAAHSPMLVS